MTVATTHKEDGHGSLKRGLLKGMAKA